MSEESPRSIDGLIDGYPAYDGQLASRRTREARDGAFVDASRVLGSTLGDALGHDLYAHQAAAIESLLDGENVTVATSTASGKTYVYALYFALLKRRNPDARALLCYPTKALSRDQERSLTDLYDRLGLDVSIGVYDGDTPTGRRREIREESDVVISNVAAINVYLESHHGWADFYGGCELVAIDEAHAYTGVHGMHVAWTIRRLRRVLDRYGSDPQLVCTSATIGNPADHVRNLTGAGATVVDEDGSPRGRREIAFWDPPFDDDPPAEYDLETYLGAKRSAASEASDLLVHLAKRGVQTIGFARSRQGTEVAAKRAERTASDHPADRPIEVAPYHAGHGRETRRETERRLEGGDLDGVIATSALELGIDVGTVDATVLAGYPGTRQSFWQRVGRAGRGRADALSVLVARADAIDRYVLEHPEYLLGEPVEECVVDLSNNVVYARHLLCAADEIPLTEADRRWFGADGEAAIDAPDDRFDRAIEMWRDAGKVVGELDRGVQYDGPPRPQADVSMYATSGERFLVRCENGEIDMEPIGRDRAYREFHEGALVLHDGTEYEVTELVESVPQPYVTLRQVSTTEYTITDSDKRVRDLDPREVRDFGGGYRLSYGTGTVRIHYDRYRRIDVFSGRSRAPPRPTGLPPIDLRTQLTWIEMPPELGARVIDRVPDEELLDPDSVSMGAADYTVLGGLHGAEHGMIKLAPLELRMDKSDLGGLSTLVHPDSGVPTWFIHDAVEGGVGFARGIYDHFESLADRTREHVATCGCDGVAGCPACLMDTQCGNRNEPLHASATVEILAAVVDRLARG